MDGFYQTVWNFFSHAMSSIRVIPPYFTASLQFISQPKPEPSISVIIKTIDPSLSQALSIFFFPQNSLLSRLSDPSHYLLILFCCLLFLSFFPQDDQPLTPLALPHDSSSPTREIGWLREVEIEIERGRRSDEGGDLLFGDFWSFLLVAGVGDFWSFFSVTEMKGWGLARESGF